MLSWVIASLVLRRDNLRTPSEPVYTRIIRANLSTREGFNARTTPDYGSQQVECDLAKLMRKDQNLPSLLVVVEFENSRCGPLQVGVKREARSRPYLQPAKLRLHLSMRSDTLRRCFMGRYLGIISRSKLHLYASALIQSLFLTTLTGQLDLLPSPNRTRGNISTDANRVSQGL